MKSQKFGAELKSYLMEKPVKVDASEIVQRMFEPSGAVGGLSIGMTLEEVNALGFTPESFIQDEHEECISREEFDDYDPRHSFEYLLVDQVLCSVIYELNASNSDVAVVEQGFSDALEGLLGAPIVVLGTKHWMFGEGAQFILGSTSESVAHDDGDEHGFTPEIQMACVSLRFWDGEEDGEFPGSFDPTNLEKAMRAFVNDTYGKKIDIGQANIWMESPYVCFNIKIEKPNDEIDFDWEGVPMTDSLLDDPFKQAIIREFDKVLD